MKRFILRIMSIFLLIGIAGCAQKNPINIGTITKNSSTKIEASLDSKQQYYLSFSSNFEGSSFSDEACNKKGNFFTTLNFSKQIYLNFTNLSNQKKYSGQLPIFILKEEDKECIFKTPNFIISQPALIELSDKINLSFNQVYEDKESLSPSVSIIIDIVKELSNAEKVINAINIAQKLSNHPHTQSYIKEKSESKGSNDTKSKNISLKENQKIIVPLIITLDKDKNGTQNFGKLILTSKLKTSLYGSPSTNTPDFSKIYTVDDISSITQYHKNIKSILITLSTTKSDSIIKKLADLDTPLQTKLTRYDRALILSLAFKQTSFYQDLKEHIDNKDIEKIQSTLKKIEDDTLENNPFRKLRKELQNTKCQAYQKIISAKKIIADNKDQLVNIIAKDNEKKEKNFKGNLENIFKNHQYYPFMFSKTKYIQKQTKFTNKDINLSKLNQDYNITQHGCYISLKNPLTDLVNNPGKHSYDFLAIELDNNHTIRYNVYELNDIGKIKRMLILNNDFIRSNNIKSKLNSIQTSKCIKIKETIGSISNSVSVFPILKNLRRV